MSVRLDDARDVRDEDRLDAAKLDAYLKPRIAGLSGEPRIRQFHGGASNLTYLIGYGDRELVLRRPPAGAKAGAAHDMLREAAVMAALGPDYRYVPAILARCDDPAVLGSEFYVMERIAGVILRRELPAELKLDRADVRKLCERFVDRLIELHAIDASRPEIAALGKGEGYVARQLSGWAQRWRNALTDGTNPCDDVLAWLERHRPAGERRICVIHNDFRFDNVVLDPADPLSIVGVLDWEMATLGDPLMDLGGSLAYWAQADDDPAFVAMRRQPTHADGMMTRRELVEYYGARTGLDVGGFVFYEVFGLFRLMVIAQQIYRRFVLGHTTNEQFAGLGAVVRYLGERCRRVIDAAGGRAMTELLLIRHAQASFDAADYDCLSPLGDEQSARLGAWMARGARRPALIATGTLRRHAQTADGCARAAGVDAPRLALAGLDELDADELIARHRPALASRDALLRAMAAEADPRRAFQTLFAAAVARWTGGVHDGEYGCAWPEFRARTLAAWDALAGQPAREIWAFTSGGPIGVIVAALFGVPAERSFELAWPLVNTSVTRIRIGRGGARVTTYNGWPHLDGERDERLVTHR